MATVKNSNDSKKAAGYLKEKFTIGLSRVTGDEVSRAIMKTTSHMLKAPNDKHLQRLIAATHGHFSEGAKRPEDMCKYIVDELEARSHTHNWIVVLKTMITLHRFLAEGSDEVNKVMQRNRNLFCMRSIKDLADSPDGAAQRGFIEQYIRYLEERNISQARIDVDYRIESDEYLTILKTMPQNVLAAVLTQLIQQLERLSEVEFRESIVDNFATLDAYARLVNDGKRLYRLISDRVIHIIEHDFDGEQMELVMKQTWLLVYRRFSRCVVNLIKLFDAIARSNRHFGVDIPRIKAFPDSLLARMEQEVACAGIAKERLEDIAPAAAASAAAQQEPKRSDDNDDERDEVGGAAPATQVSDSRSATASTTTAPATATAVAPPPPPPPPPAPPRNTLDDLFADLPVSKAPAQQQQQFAVAGAGAASSGRGGGNSNLDLFASPSAAPSSSQQQQQQPPKSTAFNNDSLFGSAGLHHHNNNNDEHFTPVVTPTGQQQQQQSTAASAPPATTGAFDPFGTPQRENVFSSPAVQGKGFAALSSSSSSSTVPAAVPVTAAKRDMGANPFGGGADNSPSSSAAFTSHHQTTTSSAARPSNDMDDLFGGPSTGGAGAFSSHQPSQQQQQNRNNNNNDNWW